jgi:hypothetical protein
LRAGADGTAEHDALIDALHTGGPAPDRAGQMGLYSWLVGRWDIDVVVYNTDGTLRSMRGFVCAGWVLQGRAIQDVFAVHGLFYGTTLRVYDPERDSWWLVWTDPLNQVHFPMVARTQGDEIVQEGKETPSLARVYGASADSNATIRWIFSDITDRSFRWRSERSTHGRTWRLQREYFGRRAAAS